MPKFTYEIDTEARTTKAFVDGQEIEATDFSVGCYTGKDYNTGAEYQECYASLTRAVNENERWTYSYSFKNGQSPSYSEATTRYSSEVSKVAAKAVARTIAQATLEKALMSELDKRNGNVVQR